MIVYSLNHMRVLFLVTYSWAQLFSRKSLVYIYTRSKFVRANCQFPCVHGVVGSHKHLHVNTNVLKRLLSHFAVFLIWCILVKHMTLATVTICIKIYDHKAKGCMKRCSFLYENYCVPIDGRFHINLCCVLKTQFIFIQRPLV